MSASRFGPKIFLAALGVVIIWGLNFVVLKVGLQWAALPPSRNEAKHHPS